MAWRTKKNKEKKTHVARWLHAFLLLKWENKSILFSYLLMAYVFKGKFIGFGADFIVLGSGR